MKNTTLRVRESIQELQTKYMNGDKKPLEDLMRAWEGIKALPPDDPRSFFMLGGFHGEPFRGAGWGSNTYWGGYCNHGNVLFPTWHRVYLVKLEEALQSIKGCENVMQPYWDETSEDSLKNGIPWALTDEFFPKNSKNPNPLRSFVFPRNIVDNINGDNPNYSKPQGYETVRYPLSGLVGTATDRAATEAHNNNFPDYEKNVALLNQNIVNWLTGYIVINGTPFKSASGDLAPTVLFKYQECLKAPNYTVFSNTTSAQEWNSHLENTAPVVPLESPHNSIHLAVGGFDVPNQGVFSPIPGANGDMGENDTAGLDPIFFFHHCNVDRMFWLWQQQHGYTDDFDIIAGYPGTNSVDSQGPTPGTAPNSWLTMDSPLDPFTNNKTGKPFTSRDCINIEKQLGFTYSAGSLASDPKKLKQKAAAVPVKTLHVSKINRAPISGSFLVSAFATIGGKRHFLGTEAVLNRWSARGCANCQLHLEVKATFGLYGFQEKALLHEEAQYDVVLHSRPVNGENSVVHGSIKGSSKSGDGKLKAETVPLLGLIELR